MSVALSRIQFLSFVKQYIENDPESAAYVQESVASGLKSALNKSNQRAADFETLFVTQFMRNNKNSNKNALILNKLKKLQNSGTCFNYDSIIADLESKISKLSTQNKE